jgi:ribose-phosphate pyrophosphokinase
MEWEPEHGPGARRLALLEMARRRASFAEASSLDLADESAEKGTLETIKILTGNANRELAQNICDHLGVELGLCTVGQFEDGEISVKIDENIRGLDVFVVQPTNPPAENMLSLLLLLDACKRASARRVTAVVPYYGYARQDRKDQPRVPITAKLVANVITVAGADRAMTMDLHSPQIQGFFDIPFDHMYAAPVMIEYMLKKDLPNLVVVAPDIGSVKMARAYAKRLGAELALVDKRRPRPDAVEVMNIIGDVEGKNIVFFDDVISTGRTLCQAAEAMRANGAREIYAGATHAVLADGAADRIMASPIREVVVTDTIPHPRESLNEKIKVLSVGGLLGEAIRRIHEERSLSSLFV